MNITRGVGLLGAVALLGACTGGGSGPTQAPTTSIAPTPGVIVFGNDPLSAGGHAQLYIESDDGSHVRRLVVSSEKDVGPSISPDGTRVMFTRIHDPRPDRIFVVNVDGSDLHQVVPTGCPGRCGDAVESDPWSPDGTRIVFTRAIYGRGPIPIHVQLWTANADGTGARQITDPHHAQDDQASWSPDGTQIVYLHWAYGHPDRFTIQIAAADGTGSRQLTPDGLDAADPAWSPDGALIAFQSPPDPGGAMQQLYTIRPDGSGLRSLTPELAGTATNHPSWSPDGSQLVFAHAPSGPLGGDLFVIDRDGTGVHVLRVTGLNENGPDWGPAVAP
ncbi:MAG TPA: hypothetical protein VLX89_08140 [Actinomycetota bacterium]|nr:hypothetical protein [Actinomycetota bacterium]